MLDIGQWSPLTSALIIGVVTLLAVKIWQSWQYLRTFKRMGIPGPTPWPLVGNMLAFRKKPFKDVLGDWKKEYGKVFGVFFPTPSIAVCDMELAKEVLIKRFNTFPNKMEFPGFSSDSSLKDNLLSIKGDHWKHVRSQLSPTFSSNKLKKIFPAIERVAKNMLNRLDAAVSKDEEVDLRSLSKLIAMDTIAGVAFGLEVDSLNDPNDEFYKNGETMISKANNNAGLFLTVPLLAKVLEWFGYTFLPKANSRYLLGVIDAALAERRSDTQRHHDLLQLLVDAEKAGESQGQVDAEIDFTKQLETSTVWTRKGLKQSEIHSNSLIFFFAGYDTVTNVTSLTLFALAAHPECLRKAQEEVDTKIGDNPITYDSAMSLTYIDMCMNETMRVHLPSVSDRVATEDYELGGYHVPKDVMVMVMSSVFHFDPAQWPEPDKFDPERFTPEERAKRHPCAFLPFGMGPRNCIGMRLAQLEIRTVIASMLRSFTPVLFDKSVYPPVLNPMNLIPKDGLMVKFVARSDAP